LRNQAGFFGVTPQVQHTALRPGHRFYVILEYTETQTLVTLSLPAHAASAFNISAVLMPAVASYTSNSMGGDNLRCVFVVTSGCGVYIHC